MKDLKSKFDELLELRNSMTLYLASKLTEWAKDNYPRIPNDRSIAMDMGQFIKSVDIVLYRHDSDRITGTLEIGTVNDGLNIVLDPKLLMESNSRTYEIGNMNLNKDTMLLGDVIKYLDEILRKIVPDRSRKYSGAIGKYIHIDHTRTDLTYTNFTYSIYASTHEIEEVIGNYRMAIMLTCFIPYRAFVDDKIDSEYVEIAITQSQIEISPRTVKIWKIVIEHTLGKLKRIDIKSLCTEYLQCLIAKILNQIDEIYDRICLAIAPELYRIIERMIERTHLKIYDKRDEIEKIGSMMKLMTDGNESICTL